MNELSLELVLYQESPYEDERTRDASSNWRLARRQVPEVRPVSAAFVITVDGEALVTPGDNSVSIRALLASRNEGGEHFILTCTCGDPGCAGYHRGISVSHQGDRVRWQVPNPPREYIFEQAEYEAAIARGIEDACELLAGEDVTNLGFARWDEQDLLRHLLLPHEDLSE